MPFGIGPLEIVIVLIIVLIVFGPKRLPDLGRSLGRGMREFKDSLTGEDKEELPAGEQQAGKQQQAGPVEGEKAEPVGATPPAEPKP
jgi:sec-independent protein translocase protein TatA